MTKDTLLQEINRFLEKLDITDLNQVYIDPPVKYL